MSNKNLTDILAEALENINEDFLNEAISADNKQAFKKLAKKKAEKGTYVISFLYKAAAVCVCVCIVAVSILASKSFEKVDNTSNKIIFNSGEISSSPNSVYITGEEQGEDKPQNSDKDNVVSNNENKDNDNSQASSENIGSNTENKPEKDEVVIDSLDKLNYYTVKRLTADSSMAPLSIFTGNNYISPNLDFSKYEISPDAVFEITMAAYFNIKLNNPNGFLAQKLGGTGKVEVAITKNNFKDLITFKRGEKYYSCLMNNSSVDISNGYKEEEIGFSTHIYVEDFSLVKNLKQENFLFTVTFNDANVVGIKAERFREDATSAPYGYEVDSINLVGDYCVVVFQKRSFTAADLEKYFNKFVAGGQSI